MKVAYLTGKDLAVHSIDWMLSDKYGRKNISAIPADTLGCADLSRFDMLVMPGCVDEISPYPQIMTDAALNNVKSSLNKGLILWTDCAATYDVMQDIEFKASDKELRRRNGWGLYKAAGKGPIEGTAIAPSPEDRFVDVVIRRIFYTCANDCSHTADICYGNGPGIHLSDEELNDPNTRVIARYSDIELEPAAAVTKKVGKGMVLSLSVLVQIAPSHLQGNPSDENMARHRSALFNHLSGAEAQRQHFLNSLFEIVDTHHQSLSAPSPVTEGYQRHANIA